MTPAQQKLLRALIHGLSSPEEILCKSGLSQRLIDILTPLVGEFDESMAFKQSYEALQEKPDFDQLVISNRIDLSELELAYLFRLAELGVKVRFEFPIDDTGQGLSLPVTYLAGRIEKRHDLKNIEVRFRAFTPPAKLVRYEAPDLVQEARVVAQIVAGYEPGKNCAIAMRTLDKRVLIFEDALKMHGLDIKVMALPELLGQKFDLVVIADAVLNRLTLSREPDWPLKDSDCFEINRLMGRQVLRRFEADILEPSWFPARQALEPMWFLGAAEAASELLVITSSALDENYQVQAGHELARLPWLGEPQSIAQLPRPLNQMELTLSRLREREILACQNREREFQFDAQKFREKFSDKLGFSSEKPLSATRIEAFAHCRFRAFIEKLLEIDLHPPKMHDLSSKDLGIAAHEALEQYYVKGVEFEQSLASLQKPEHTHEGVWKANLLWLQEALKRLVSNLEKRPVIPGAKPIAFEKKLEPMALQVGADQIYLGGVVDRVDESSDAVIAVDYKLAALSRLRMRFAASEILKTHFQLPIYLKLLQQMSPRSTSRGPGFTGELDPGSEPGMTNDAWLQKGLLGYAVSIQDGAPGPLIDMTKKLQELDQALSRLLEPILQGFVPADVQESCNKCTLKRVCRV